MKIALVTPGIMEIPPQGWGGVESVIWDYTQALTDLDHEVLIVNDKDWLNAIAITNNFNPDFVHLHLDDHIKIIPHLNCKTIAITSHYAYADQPEKHGPYAAIFNEYKNTSCYVFCLSESIKETLIKKAGYESNLIHVFPNGIDENLFTFEDSPKYPDRTIYLAKIDYRKRQHIFQSMGLNMDFAGNIADSRFNSAEENYLGEWPKPKVYTNLTDYASLALLSDGEGHARVCIEAFAAGLGVVVSEYATAHLDVDLPFVDLIPEDKMEDQAFIKNVIIKNRNNSINMRREIREYGIEKFSLKNIIKDYEKSVIELVNR